MSDLLLITIIGLTLYVATLPRNACLPQAEAIVLRLPYNGPLDNKEEQVR